MFTDAYCVRAYQLIRQGVRRDAVRISEGRNIYPPSKALLDHLARLTQNLLNSDRFTYYESPADDSDRELVANLLSEYLDYQGIEARHLLFTNGSQEAISIVSSFCASRGLAAILPLPLYYSYEQSSLRFGMPVNGYYRLDGKIKWLETTADKLFQVVQLPNPVTGTLFVNPDLDRANVPLTLFDCIYQLGAYGGPHELAHRTRTAIGRFSLDKLVLLFTASKDLSLPGLRCSVLVTGNDELLDYARADRFERIYSVNPLLGQIMAAYFALLLMNESRFSDSGEARYHNLHEKFTDAGAPLAPFSDLLSMVEHFDSMTAHCRQNMRLLERDDSPVQLAPEPFAGYSVFPQLRRRFDTSDEFLHWTNLAGRQHGLKLNPAYMFGGTPEIWDELHPDETRVRVNLSYPATALADALQRLAAAVGAPAKT